MIENQCQEIFKRGSKHYYEGRNTGNKDNYYMAIQCFNEVIKLQPNHAAAYKYRGDSYSRIGSFNAAIIDLDIAFKTLRFDAVLINSRGYVYSRLREYDRAIKNFNRVINRFWDKPPNRLPHTILFAYTSRGFAYFRKNDFDQAIKDCDAAISLEASYYTAYNYRGLIHYAIEEYNQAINDHTQAICHNGNYARSYNFRGLAHAATENYDDAIADYNEAIRLKEGNPHALIYLNRGNAYQEMGQIKKAIDDYDYAVRVCSNYRKDLNEDPNVEFEYKDAVGKAVELLTSEILSQANFIYWTKSAAEKVIKLLTSVIPSQKKQETQGTRQKLSGNEFDSQKEKKRIITIKDCKTSKDCYYLGMLSLLDSNDPGPASEAFNEASNLSNLVSNLLNLGCDRDKLKDHIENLKKLDPIRFEDNDN